MEVEGKLSIHSTSKEEKGEVIHKVCDENEDSQGGSWTTFPFVIATVLGLTVAAGGWGANLIVFLITKFNVKTITATKINNIILGTNNLFPIAGAFIADSFFTTFSVVGAFSFISLLGVIMLTLIATIPSLRPSPCPIGSLITCQAPSKLQYSALYVALSLASLGLGGTRFTIATMGADQFNNPTDQGVFFNWYFVALYMATVFSGTAIVYIQDNVGWGLGFGICCIANGIGLGVFSSGKRFYKQVKPKGSPFLSIARVLVAAVRKRKMSSRTSTEPDYYYGAGANANAMTDNPPTTSLSFLNCAALKIEDDKQFEGSYGNPWGLCTVEEVEDLKTVIKIMPLWSTGIFVSTPIAIICSLTILQALTMDRHLGPHFEIPAATFLVFTLFSTAICIFIIDRFILLKYKNLTGQALTSIQRIGIGHIINIMSFAGAALVERRRLGVVRAHSLMNQPGSEVPMSALWLVAPLSVLGLAESFHFPGQVSLCYQEFPKSLRSTSTAMISLLLGIGYYLCTAVTDLVDKTTNWLPDDINQGRLDNVYWMLVVIGVVNFGYYMTCAKVFVSQNQNVVK